MSVQEPLHNSTVRALEAIATPSLTILNFSPGVYICEIVALGGVSENWEIFSDNPVQIFIEIRVIVLFLYFYGHTRVGV